MDKASQQLGVDRVELRRKNFIASTAMPFTTTAGEIYDSGEFERVMDTVTEKADWAGINERRSVSHKNGKRRGIGLCYYIESTMGEPGEAAEVKFSEDGTVNILVGTQSNGQGHETAFRQILCERLGVAFENVSIVQGDSDLIETGGGTMGSGITIAALNAGIPLKTNVKKPKKGEAFLLIKKPVE